MSTGLRIRQARLQAGLSQAELAQRLGVTRSACSQWESRNGTVPRPQRLEQIANVLAVSYEWLATGRSENRLAEDRPAYALSPEQQELLRLYARLSEKRRLALLAFLRAL